MELIRLSDVERDRDQKCLTMTRTMQQRLRAMNAAQEEGPRAGSIVDVERTDAAHDFAFLNADEYLAVAADHIGAYHDSLTSRVRVWAPYTLLRPVVECSARAWWLLGPKLSASERLARGVATEWERRCQARKFAGGFVPDAAGVAEREHAKARSRLMDLLALAVGLGLPVQPQKRPGEPREPAWFGPPTLELPLNKIAWVATPFPSATDAAAGMFKGNPIGAVAYRMLSSPTHGNSKPTHPERRVLGTGIGGRSYAGHASVNFSVLESMTAAASLAFEQALLRLVGSLGSCSHRVFPDMVREAGWHPPGWLKTLSRIQVERGEIRNVPTCHCCGGKRIEITLPALTRTPPPKTWGCCEICPPDNPVDRWLYWRMTGDRLPRHNWVVLPTSFMPSGILGTAPGAALRHAKSIGAA